MEALSETSKNNLLQLENSEEYKNKLTDLCYEVIKRDERLRASLNSSSNEANNVRLSPSDTRPFKGYCNNCGMRGHKAIECKGQPNIRRREYADKNVNKRNFDWNRVKFKNGGYDYRDQERDRCRNRDRNRDNNSDRNRNQYDQANIVESEYDEDRYECLFCHERNSHRTKECPHVDVQVNFLTQRKVFDENAEKNKEDDEKNPHKKYRIA